MNNKKKNEGQTDFSYYGLYLLDYLRNNRFEQATDTAFIRERADRAAETYERARLDGYPAEGAQELAMNVLLRGLHYSKYDIIGKLAFHDFAEDGVTGIMQPAQQRVHRQFLRTIGGIAFKPCPLIRFGGTVGPFPYESGVVSLFKLVRAEIVQQVQTVIGKVGLTLVFLLVVHYFGFSGLIINGIIGWKKEEKGTRYPSECHH